MLGRGFPSEKPPSPQPLSRKRERGYSGTVVPSHARQGLSQRKAALTPTPLPQAGEGLSPARRRPVVPSHARQGLSQRKAALTPTPLPQAGEGLRRYDSAEPCSAGAFPAKSRPHPNPSPASRRGATAVTPAEFRHLPVVAATRSWPATHRSSRTTACLPSGTAPRSCRRCARTFRWRAPHPCWPG